MEHFSDWVGFLSAEFSLRPLLCVSGVTATVAGVYCYYYYYNYYYYNKRERLHTTLTEDPVQTGSVDDSLDSMPDVGGVNVKPTVSENPEEENQKVEVSSERAELEDRVSDLEELLSDTHRECVRKNKVFRARAKRKYKKAMKSIAKLQKENSDLKSSVNTLQDSVQHLGILLSETHTQSAQSSRLYESEVNLRRYMQSEYDKSEENYNEKITSLRVSLAEAERQYERSMESNTQLEGEISGLRSEVSRLEGSVEQLGAELSDTHTRCNELTSECISREHEMSILQSECNKMKEILLKDCEREPEVQRMLLAQNDKMKELLKQKEELLKDSLAEAERTYDQAMSSKAQLESDLRSEVNTLQVSVQKMEEELSKKHRDCEEMKREIEAYRMQKLQGEVMRESLEQLKKLLKECMQERESHSVLTSQCNLMALTHSEDALKLSLAECEKNCEQAEVINAQLVNEKSVLMSRLNKLQASVQGLSNLLSETHMKCETAAKERASATAVLAFVQSKAKKQKRFLMQKKKSLQFALRKAKRKYKKSLRRNTELRNEHADQTAYLLTLEDQIGEKEEELSESRRRCDEVTAEHEQKTQELAKLNSRLSFCKESALSLINDYQKEWQAHEALKVQYKEMKEWQDELQKHFQATPAEVVVKYEQAMENNTQLENERLRLMHNVHKLEGRVWEVEKMLYDADKKYNVLKQDHERAKEAYSILQSDYDEALNQDKQSLNECEQQREAYRILKMRYDQLSHNRKFGGRYSG